MCLIFNHSIAYQILLGKIPDGWNLESKFNWGRTDVVNKHAPKETQEYIAKYYNEDLEILNSYVITEAMYWKLKQTGKPFYIFTNAFTDYIHKDWKIFKQSKLFQWTL